MDEEYTDSIDTSADMDVLDVDIPDANPEYLTDDIPEDISEEEYSEPDVLEGDSEYIHEEDNAGNIDYNEMDESIDEDISAQEVEENGGSIDAFEEDTFEVINGEADSEDTTNDIAEDTAIFETDSNEDEMENEDIPEDVEVSELINQDITVEEDILEDTEPLEDMETEADKEPEMDREAKNDKENMDVGNTESAESLENLDDFEDIENTANVEDDEAIESPEELHDTETPEDSDDDENISTREQLENSGDIEIAKDDVDDEITEQTVDVIDMEGTGSEEQPEETDNKECAEPEGSGFKRLLDYMSSHNYGAGDFATYSQDPQWRMLMREEYPDYELPELSQESANTQLMKYMSDNNYGMEDYAVYSQDPIWRELHAAAFPDDKETQPINQIFQSEKGIPNPNDLRQEYDNSYEAQELRDMGIKNVDLRECLPEYRGDIVDAVKDMLSENPELKQQLSDVRCCTIDDRRYADYGPTQSGTPFGGRLRLNSKFFSSNSLSADLDEESKQGWSVPNASPRSIVSHELGHGIHLDLCAKSCGISPGTIPEISRYQEAVRQYMDDVHADTIVETACRDLGVKFNTDDFANHLSRYGSDEYGEALAEAVAEVRNNLNPRPMARTIYYRLMQYKNRMNGGKMV